jgi:D-glycero-alpha-D-manno-heptose-7-phosphate kinase
MAREVFSRAASRVDFGGGTLDLPFFADREKGATLNCSIAKYGYASIKLNNKQLEINSLNYDEVKKIPLPIVYNGDLDLLKSAFKYTNFKEKATVTTYHEMVPHSRLGTSSSISVALLGAILRWQKKKLDRAKISDVATMMERNELHMDNGPQDQYAAAMGGILMLRYKGAKKTTCEVVKVKDEVYYELEKNFVMCYLDSEEVAGDVNHETVEGYEKGDERVVGAIKNIKQVTEDMYKQLKKGNVHEFAELLNEETKNRIRLNKDIVTPNCQRFIKIGMENGALSAKILGAGAGGTLLFYAKDNMREKLAKALAKHNGKIMDFRFDYKGLCTWEKNVK